MAQEVASLSESGFYALTRYSYLILIKAGRVFLKERRDVFMITLFDDYPIIVDRVLAQKIGLNESLFIQQLHYWTKINASANRNYYDSYYWTYNTYEAWHEQFPFWSLSTLKRLIKGLEKKGYIIVGNYNKIKIDKTKWYRINYEALGIPEKSPKCQNDPSRVSNWSVEQVNMNQAIPNTSSETTTENKKNIYITLPSDDPFLDFYLKMHKQYLDKEHNRVQEHNLKYIEDSIIELKGEGLELEEWQDGVIEHFENLPESNNGNILAFLPASFRYFNIDLYHT